ncbi:MAG: GNAT family N-acetyltransferase [Chloroflexi bacterium]|nr:GNAT family N-acetyltransferase [Chloroflexota bacterium]
MTVWLATQPLIGEHIRPFDPRRDLEGLADLIEIAFGRELALTESRMVQDMRQVAQWGPILWAAQAFQLFAGYVWVEGDTLVGNVSFSRDKQADDTWIIANVAVLPEYRGRGIAGRLMDAAIEHIRRQGGKRILLQVKAENEPARALYRHRGFVPFDTLHELSLSPAHWPLLLGSPDKRLRPVRRGDQQALFRLVQASTPPEVLRRRPIRASDFRRNIFWQLGQTLRLLLGGKALLELIAEGDKGLLAYGALTAQLLRGSYEMAIHVLPEQRGHWELALIQGLFHLLERLPRQTVRANVSSSHPEALQAFECMGFRTLRVLEQMSLELEE